MRNLKKFLALVLAFMMAMSLMTTVSAKNVEFDDGESVTEAFQDDITILAGMGVIKGVTENEFQPLENVTRAEMAAIVYRLHTGDAADARSDLYAGNGEFKDVTEDKWYAGYVGYCYNAQLIIGYGDGTFRPSDPVTGYEMLVMLLRAMGYTQPNEFSGSDWQVHAAEIATRRGLLAKVNTTRYQGTLSSPAKRELVAEVAFQAAAPNHATVEWTNAYGYQTSAAISGDPLQSLGRRYYGLTQTTRIVLGNQATGEDGTVLGNVTGGEFTYTKGDDSGSAVAAYSEYDYPGTVLVAKGDTAATSKDKAIVVPNNGLNLDWESDLGLFAHEVTAWYNANDVRPNKQTYAVFDEVELAAVVASHDDTDGAKLSDAAFDQSDNTDAKTGKNSLGAVAKAEGFRVNLENSEAHWSDSFSRFNVGTAKAGTAKASEVYVLVSNNPDKTVDAVIAVNLDVGEIDRVNNQAGTKTFSVNSATNTGVNDLTEQDAVMNPDEIKLGNTVVVTEVTHNTVDNGDPVYWMDTPAETVTKTVVAYDATTQEVTFSDGETLERTIIDNAALVSGKTNVTTLTTLEYAKYEFLLDTNGNWINARRIYDNNFLYSTYLDYSTSLGSSTFTYRVVGVDLNGEVQHYDFTNYWLQGASNEVLDGASNKPEDVKIPFRNSYMDDKGSSMAGRDATNKYRGFIINSKLIDNRNVSLWDVAGVQSLAADTGVASADDFVATSTVAIDKNAVALGVVKFSKSSSGYDLYLTEKTKFIVVNEDGYGTDTLDPKVYTGLTELLGSGSSLTLDAATNGGEILFTSSPYLYANTTVTAKQVDTIIIPETELTPVGGKNLYFFPSKTDITDADGSGAQLFTAYLDGEKVTRWVRASDVSTIETNIDTGKYGSFQYLEPTTDKAADDGIIYKIAGAPTITTVDGVPGSSNVCWTGTTYGAVDFVGTTNNGLTAIMNSGATVVGTANAKVVNLVKGYTINNIDDLNSVASLADANTTTEGEITKVLVDVQYVEEGSNQVAYIYVVAVETYTT